MKRKQECPTELRSAQDSVLNCSEMSESKFLGHLLFLSEVWLGCTKLISNIFAYLSFRVQFMKRIVYIQRGGGESIKHLRNGPVHNGHSTPVQVLSQILPEATSSVKALVLKKPGEASVETVPNPVAAPGELLLRVRMVGFCGSDLNSFRGRNPLVTFPRIPGHEVSATVIEGDSSLPAGCSSFSIYELRRLRFLPEGTFECVQVQSDSRRTTGRGACRIRRDA